FPSKEIPPLLRPSTVRWLKQAMFQTVKSGTGRLLAELPGGAAGKTGTAQTGEKGRVHCWFTGFAPAKEPRYVVTVLARDRDAEEDHLGLIAAKEMMRWLAVSPSQSD